MDVAKFERDAEAFSKAICRETYLQSAGFKETLELRPIYTHFGHLFSIETYEALDQEELERKYRRFLQEFVASNFIETQITHLTEQVAGAEATATVPWEGEELSYRSVPVKWANEPRQDARHGLYERWREQTHAVNSMRLERHLKGAALAPELGFRSSVHLWNELRGLHLEELSAKIRGLLDQTRDTYADELRAQLLHAEVDPGDAWKVDLGWLFRAPAFDTAFRAEELLPVLHRTLAGLGLRLEEQSNVKLDTEYRPKKSPRAFCAPLEIPDDVRLVIMPSGGRTDYESLFHEAGHAEHFANVDRTLPFAYRWLGDNSITEGYAYLIEYLTTDQAWLRHYLDYETVTDYLRLSLFNKLYMLRRYGTKVLYEQELHAGAEGLRESDDQRENAVAQLYADTFTDNLGVHYFPEEYLSDVDDGFYSAQYLRAWTLEGQLRLYLKKEYDEEWFRMPKAGKFLVELWREGQKYTAEELLRFMGYDGLDFGPMLDEIRSALEI